MLSLLLVLLQHNEGTFQEEDGSGSRGISQPRVFAPANLVALPQGHP